MLDESELKSKHEEARVDPVGDSPQVKPPSKTPRGTMYDMDPIQGSADTSTTMPGARGMVRRMLNRSGNSLLVAIEPLSDEEFFTGGPNGISVAWTVGHLACVFDLFTSWIHAGGCKLPKAVHDVFNSLELRPPGGPTKAEIVEKSGHGKGDIHYLLRMAQVRALKLLDACDPREWHAAPPGPHPDNLASIGEIWEHLAVHTYWHMGELCGTFPRFHGTYTLNMLPHYFYYLPADSQRE